MQAGYRPIALQPGEALALDRRAATRLVVAEGEVLVHAPAQWLGETVVFTPPRRVAAPAVFSCKGLDALTAVGSATIRLEATAGAFQWLRSAWRHGRPVRAGEPLLARE